MSREYSDDMLEPPRIGSPTRFLSKSPDTVSSWEALEAQEAWDVWTVKRWQLIKVKRRARAGPNVVWRCTCSSRTSFAARTTTRTPSSLWSKHTLLPCLALADAYALENKGLVWGGSLKVLWAAHDEFGGVEVDGSGAPVVGLRSEDDDDNADVDAYEEIRFTNNGFPYCEPAEAIPMKARKGGAPMKYVEPLTGSLKGMPGFTFFVEHTRISDDFAIPDEEQFEYKVR